MKFAKQDMLDLLEDGSDVISDEISGKSRWSVNHSLLFRKDGKIYKTYYSVGATENQDESPWEYDKEVVCVEMEAYEKTIMAYRPVSAPVVQVLA